MPIWSPEAQTALVLSTLAGLSTGIGGCIAIVKKPDNALLAALLGIAIGVMTTLSVLEMFVRNAYEHGIFGISLAVLGGWLTYFVLQPYFPDFENQSPAQATLSPKASSKSSAYRQSRCGQGLEFKSGSGITQWAVQVAFSSFTDFGPYMAFAIAIHNIPEGVIVAAPVFAATGSRWKAMGMSIASGLSEPLGALIALLLVKPFITEEPLHYILAFVGGIMMSVCAIELWPEAKRCKEDARLAQGIFAGTVVMAVTLAMGV